MKKTLPLVLAILLILSACSSTPQAYLTVQEDHYTCTPQSTVDFLNTLLTDQGDSRYLSIPDYAAPGEDIAIGGPGFSLCLDEDGNGYLTKMELEWVYSQANGERTFWFLVGAIERMCTTSTEDAEHLDQRLDINPYVGQHDSYTTTAQINGSTLTYNVLGGRFFTLTVEPSKSLKPGGAPPRPARYVTFIRWQAGDSQAPAAGHSPCKE